MAESNLPTLQIPKDVIEPIIQAHVKKAVVDAFGGYQSLVEKAISQVMTMKVDRDGKHSGYSSDVEWLTWAMRDCVQKAAKEAIQEYLGTNREKIKEQIARALRGRNSALARQLIEGMTKALTHENILKYHFTVTVAD